MRDTFLYFYFMRLWIFPQNFNDFFKQYYIPVSYTHLDVYKRQVDSVPLTRWKVEEKS